MFKVFPVKIPVKLVMKMKIPIVDPTNIYNNHESPNDFMASENIDSSQPEEGDSPTADDDFSEYLWMENEEEFDKQVIFLRGYVEKHDLSHPVFIS